MSLLFNRTVPALQRNFSPSANSSLQSSRHGSDVSIGLRTYSSKPRQDSSGKDQEPPQLPKFSLDGLGATPAMKVFIYTAIGIMGTVETYTYSLWIYHKLYPEQAGQGRSDPAEVDG